MSYATNENKLQARRLQRQAARSQRIHNICPKWSSRVCVVGDKVRAHFNVPLAQSTRGVGLKSNGHRIAVTNGR
jgi:hypothetical protein